MTVKTQSQLLADVTAKVADNSSGDVSEQDIREVTTDIVDTMFDIKSDLQSGLPVDTSVTNLPTATLIGTNIVPLPDHPDFQDGSPSLNACNGPFYFSVFDLDTATKKDGSPAIASPTGRYVAVFSSDHTSGNGGLWVAWADSPEGPFTLESDDPQVDASDVTGATSQLEAVAKILWNRSTEKFVVFPHAPTATDQKTFKLTTTDFTTWVDDGVVVDGATTSHSGYGELLQVGGQLFMDTLSNGSPERGYQRWQALDSSWDTWQKVYGKTRFATPNPFHSIDPQALMQSAGGIFKFQGVLYATVTIRYEPANDRDDEIYIAQLANDGWHFATEPVLLIAQSASAGFGDATVHVPTTLVSDGSVYVYCSAIRTSDFAQAINCYRLDF